MLYDSMHICRTEKNAASWSKECLTKLLKDVSVANDQGMQTTVNKYQDNIRIVASAALNLSWFYFLGVYFTRIFASMCLILGLPVTK